MQFKQLFKPKDLRMNKSYKGTGLCFLSLYLIQDAHMMHT